MTSLMSQLDSFVYTYLLENIKGPTRRYLLRIRQDCLEDGHQVNVTSRLIPGWPWSATS